MSTGFRDFYSLDWIMVTIISLFALLATGCTSLATVGESVDKARIECTRHDNHATWLQQEQEYSHETYRL